MLLLSRIQCPLFLVPDLLIKIEWVNRHFILLDITFNGKVGNAAGLSPLRIKDYMPVTPAFLNHSPQHGICPACPLYPPFLFPCIWPKTEKLEIDLCQCSVCFRLKLPFSLEWQAQFHASVSVGCFYIQSQELNLCGRKDARKRGQSIDREWIEQNL